MSTNRKSIQVDPSLTLEIDHFGIEFDPNGIRIPSDLKETLEDCRIKTIGHFVSQIQVMPTAISKKLGWSPIQVLKACKGFIELLRENYPDDPEWKSSPPRGALFPNGALDISQIPTKTSEYDA
jgi:hypothetical protein